MTMNDAACILILDFLNLVVRLLPIFMCLKPLRKDIELIAAVTTYIWVIMVAIKSLLHRELVVSDVYQGIFSLLFFLVVLALFDGSIQKKLFLYLSAWMFSLLFTSLGSFIARLTSGFKPFSYYQSYVLTGLLFTLIFYLLVKLWLGKTIEQIFLLVSRRSLYLLLAYPAITLVVFSVGFHSVLSIDYLMVGKQENILFYLLFTLMIILIYILILKNVLDIVSLRQTALELTFARQLVSEQRERYNHMLDSIENMQLLKHDFRHHIDALLSQDETQRRSYLLQLRQDYGVNSDVTVCENKAVNGLIGRYVDQCRQYDINLRTHLDISQHIPVDDLTLCIIIGNLMENAMEACKRLNGDRYINIDVRWVDNRLYMVVENSYDGVIIKKGDTIVSCKQDGGLGFVSIRRLTSQKNDDFSVSYTDTAFTAFVTLTDRTQVV